VHLLSSPPSSFHPPVHHPRWAALSSDRQILWLLALRQIATQLLLARPEFPPVGGPVLLQLDAAVGIEAHWSGIGGWRRMPAMRRKEGSGRSEGVFVATGRFVASRLVRFEVLEIVYSGLVTAGMLLFCHRTCLSRRTSPLGSGREDEAWLSRSCYVNQLTVTAWRRKWHRSNSPSNKKSSCRSVDCEDE
jgi:hypothetical protein